VGGNDARRRAWCEGRPLRWNAVVGEGGSPFLGLDSRESKGARVPPHSTGSDARLHDGSTASTTEEETVSRELEMYVMRGGKLYVAAATITYLPEDEGSFEWMADAIAVLDTSVDMAEANNATSTD
jgi:hypothetical protein